MRQTWQLQEAKNKLSEVVDSAIKEGPQVITRRGEDVVVVLSIADYRKTTASREKLSAFFQRSPLKDVRLDLTRDKSPARKDPFS